MLLQLCLHLHHLSILAAGTAQGCLCAFLSVLHVDVIRLRRQGTHSICHSQWQMQGELVLQVEIVATE